MKLLNYLWGKANNFVHRVDSSNKTSTILLVAQVLASSALTLHSNDIYPNYKEYFLKTYFWLQFFVISVLILKSVISYSWGSIKLYLKKSTGLLYDLRYEERNIALRGDTLKTIISEIEPASRIYDTGVKAGEKFYDYFNPKLKIAHSEALDPKKTFKEWIKYDSTSGMGKFKVEYDDDNKALTVKLQNPFHGDCSEKPLCEYLKGYITGFSGKVVGKIASTKACKLDRNCDSCIFKYDFS